MPTVRANGITMYYELHGSGEPLVLIAGLNSDHGLYRTIVPQLAAHYQVLVFDNRGVGQTDQPDVPYSMELMADDTAALLQAVGITKANILGTSMGGRIAVALALRHPDLVKRLILVSTTMSVPSRSWRRRLIALELRLPFIRHSNRYYAVRRQLDASSSANFTSRLGEIHVPTLILHGTRDRLAPYQLAEAMREGIKGSQLVTFGGGHLFFLLRAKQFITAIVAFLG